MTTSEAARDWRRRPALAATAVLACIALLWLTPQGGAQGPRRRWELSALRSGGRLARMAAWPSAFGGLGGGDDGFENAVGAQGQPGSGDDQALQWTDNGSSSQQNGEPDDFTPAVRSQAATASRTDLIGQPPKVWLYSLIAAEFPGAAAMLRHWLRHYSGSGFREEHMLLVVHHRNSTSGTAGSEVRAVRKVLTDFGVGFSEWTDVYSSDAHLEVKLRLLQQRVTSPADWIVIADSDELDDYSAVAGSIQEYVQKLEDADATFGAGMLVDRVAANGTLRDVRPKPSIQEQFPLHCAIVRDLIGGNSWKIVAFRAFLRTNSGNHKVVSPPSSRWYYGSSPPGEQGPRGSLQGEVDVFDLTPYAAEAFDGPLYSYAEDQRAPAEGRWRAYGFGTAIPVYHFKWRPAVQLSAAARLAYYRGDDSGKGSTPRFAHFGESQAILDMIEHGGGGIPVEEAHCTEGQTWELSPVLYKQWV